jgi:hypothetical protein
MAKSLISLLALVGLLSGAPCHSQELPMLSTPLCKPTGNNKDCKIPVLVAESAGACSVMVDPKLTDIAFPRGQVDKHIFWEIIGPAGYGFTQDGIAIEQNMPRDFDKPKLFNNDRVFRWKNLHKLADPKVYYYMVNVTNADGTITCSQDPRINNE